MKNLRSPQTVACFLMCVCTIALTFLVSGRAQSGDTIHGCARRNNGQLRVVSGAGQCNPSEYEISWGGGGPSSGGHLQKTTVVMSYGESQILTLPEDNRPTMVNVCSIPVGGDDGITISPPRAGCAASLYYRDSSDGRTVSTTEHFENVGNFGAGGLKLSLDEEGRLVLSNTECGDCGIFSPNPITYHVDMWY
jgi:hypothetical protein